MMSMCSARCASARIIFRRQSPWPGLTRPPTSPSRTGRGHWCADARRPTLSLGRWPGRARPWREWLLIAVVIITVVMMMVMIGVVAVLVVVGIARDGVGGTADDAAGDMGGGADHRRRDADAGAGDLGHDAAGQGRAQKADDGHRQQRAHAYKSLSRKARSSHKTRHGNITLEPWSRGAGRARLRPKRGNSCHICRS